MKRLLIEWIPGSKVSDRFKSAWKIAEVRSRASEIACSELAAWDGATEAPSGDGALSSNLLLAIRYKLQPLPCLSFALVVKDRRGLGSIYSLKKQGQSSKVFSDRAVSIGRNLAGGLRTVDVQSGFNIANFLFARIELQDSKNSKSKLFRNWKDVVVFRQDQESG